MKYLHTQSIILVILAGLLFKACSNRATDSTTDSTYELEAVSVITKQAGAQGTDASTVLSGVIQSKNKSTVSARMMGYVTSLNVEVGDRVSVGQTILTLKNNELPAKKAQIKAGIAEAEAALKNVKINYDRMKKLWEQESITKKEWDDISAQYDMMKAKVEGSNYMKNEIDAVIALTTVSAPISGVITSKNINMGDLVNPGAPLMTIEGNKGYEVVTYVSDNQISEVKKGMIIDCHVKALDKAINAKITEISPSAINTGGQFAIKADLQLNNQEKKLIFPGMYANVHMAFDNPIDQTQGVFIDKSAIIHRGQLTGIYTISHQNTALLRWIRVGKDYGDRMEVVSGLKPGEEYVIGDLSELSDGIPVVKK